MNRRRNTTLSTTKNNQKESSVEMKKQSLGARVETVKEYGKVKSPKSVQFNCDMRIMK